MKIVNSRNLPQFLSDAKPNAIIKTDSNPQVLTLKEEPLVFMPEKFKMKLQNNSELFEKFFGSFESFLRLNPQKDIKTNEAIRKLEPSTVSHKLQTTDTELQKEYDPVTKVDSGFQKSLNQNLKCYLNACVSENLNERAFAVLMSIRKSNPFKKYKVEFDDPELYIDLLTKYSTIQNWTRVNEIYEVLIAEKISITPQIYMNILDCLGRMNDSTNTIRLSREFINKAKAQVSNKGVYFPFFWFCIKINCKFTKC